MNSKKNSTSVLLIILSLSMLVGTIANVYCGYLNFTDYQPDSFNPSSFWDWLSIISKGFVLVFLYIIFRKSSNNYAKYLWLTFLIALTFDSLLNIVFNWSASFRHKISAIENGVLFFIMLIFLYLYQKYKFNVFGDAEG